MGFPLRLGRIRVWGFAYRFSVIPAEAGIQGFQSFALGPAFAEATKDRLKDFPCP
jgi:hypothetical protein